MSLLEPDVSLTDFGLALECGCFAVWLLGRSRTLLSLSFAALFAAAGFAALLGGIEHGLLADKQSSLAQAVWTGTLLAIGIAALASWVVGALLVTSGTGAMRVAKLAGLLFAGYAAVILFVSQSFTVAVVHYLPAAAFLLIAFALAYLREPANFLLAGLAGMVLTFVAAAVQQIRIDLHPIYFNYNALYHLIQAFGFVLLFLAARALVKPARVG
jgi:uncharacterized protein DUF6962